MNELALMIWTIGLMYTAGFLIVDGHDNRQPKWFVAYGMVLAIIVWPLILGLASKDRTYFPTPDSESDGD